MKLTHVLALAVISSVGSLSAFAQAPAVRDGSSWNRAPLPSNRPADFVSVTKYTTDGSAPEKTVLIATHIGGPTANERVAVVAPAAPVARVVLATPVKP